MNAVFRNLPSVDELLRSDAGTVIVAAAGERHAAEVVRTVIGELRAEISGDPSAAVTKAELFERAESRLSEAWRTEMLTGSHRVINATGVVIHTNLGRAALSVAARKAIGVVLNHIKQKQRRKLRQNRFAFFG